MCFILCFLMIHFLSISVILHKQQINSTLYSIAWHSCLFWILLIPSTRLFTPRMCFVCFIASEWPDCLHMSEKNPNCFTFVFCWQIKVYSDLKSTLKILFLQFGSLKSRSLEISCFQLNYSILRDLLHWRIRLSQS